VKIIQDYPIDNEFEMHKQLKLEEREYPWYTVPLIKILGVSPEERVKVDERRRLPPPKKENIYGGRRLEGVLGRQIVGGSVDAKDKPEPRRSRSLIGTGSASE